MRDTIKILNSFKNKNFLIPFGLFVVSFPFLWQVYAVIFFFSFKLVYGVIFNGTSVWNPEHLGKEVKLAPFAVVTKMQNYGGWRDEYLWVFANKPELPNQPRLNELSTFKVIDEKTDSSFEGANQQVCIIENIKNKNQKVSIDCKDIQRINETTKIYTEISNNVKKYGKAYIATTGDRRNSKLKSILKINSFIVFEVSTEEEIKEVFAPNDDQNESYEYIMRFNHLIRLSKEELYDEAEQSKIFLHDFGGFWEEGVFGYSDFEKYIQANKTAPDMEKWLMENHSNSIDRWAIRSILSIIQQALSLEGKMDNYRATGLVRGLEASKSCVASYYSISIYAKRDIDKALEKFFEIGDRQMVFNRIKNKFSTSYSTYPEPCHSFFPPVICGGEEKCESWTR